MATTPKTATSKSTASKQELEELLVRVGASNARNVTEGVSPFNLSISVIDSQGNSLQEGEVHAVSGLYRGNKLQCAVNDINHLTHLFFWRSPTPSGNDVLFPEQTGFTESKVSAPKGGIANLCKQVQPDGNYDLVTLAITPSTYSTQVSRTIGADLGRLVSTMQGATPNPRVQYYPLKATEPTCSISAKQFYDLWNKLEEKRQFNWAKALNAYGMETNVIIPSIDLASVCTSKPKMQLTR